MTGTATNSATIEDDLTDLRIIIGYMMFDQEAFKREIKYLQGLIK